MAVADLDLPQLATFCSIPQSSINTLLDAPTAELIQTLLHNISTKAREYTELESDKIRTGVELETAIRGQEAKTRTFKAQLGKATSESAILRQRLQAEESAKISIATELQDLQNATSTSTSDISSLNTRIELLEASNREKLSRLETKNTAYDDLVVELNSEHQKTVELRKQLSVSEQSLEEERSALSAVKFREQNQQQTIEQLEKRNDYFDAELKAKISEHTKFRKEKHHEISQLGRQFDEESSNVRQLQNGEAILRRTLEEVSEKADERSQRMQALQEEFMQKENDFQLELDAANRLAKLRENSATTERERVHDLTEQLDNFRQSGANEMSRIQAELETEHTAREEAESRIAELEVQIERLQDSIASLQAPESRRGTPSRSVNGFSAHSPERGDLTPQSQSPGSSRLKGSLSVTRLFSENSDLKRHMALERRKNEELTEAMSTLVTDMESQAPEIEDLKTEHARLESEVSDLSSLVDTIGKERDQAVKEAKKHEGQIDAKIKEGEILRQQLRDLSSQIKLLLMESQLREQGQQDLSREDRIQLERLARQDLEIDGGEGLTDTNRYISINLVPFRNTVELQEQNTKLLKLTRELGERMEHEETLRLQAENAHNWDELQHKYERCKEEMKSLVTQSQSYIRERDMFRTMLEHRGQLPQGTDFDSSNGDAPILASSQAQVLDSTESIPAADDKADYARLVKDMQSHFDAYRNEAATDRATLKQQIDDLTKTHNELRSEAARSNSKAMLSHDRYEMLHTNYTLLKSENSEIQKRSQAFYENAAKQDLRVQQAAEDLVEARGMMDSLRNETANLKAEKEFWKTVEQRITDDNENLIQERSRLNSLNASLQSLLNEREHSDNETRRRLQSQIDNLEAELQKTATSLREEDEENKRSASRREFESTQNQRRIDDLVSGLGTTREDFVKANTAKEHLSRQVDDLTIELKSAKERLDVLQSAPVSSSANGVATSSNANSTQISGLNSEQELKVRVSELQRDLGLANKEVEDMRSQVEQYKAISQASEDELHSLNETQDLFRQETDKTVAEKVNKIRQLEQRVQDISTELTSLNHEVGELRNTEAEHDRTVNEQRREFETKIEQLKDEDERHAAAAQYYLQDLKAQASIAQQAQQNYENELVKHADAAKALQQARNELNAVKIELVEARTEYQTARLNLSQNEESWTESKDRFEREIGELRAARLDLKGQNDRLHQQIETLNTAHKHAGFNQDQGDENPSDTGLENLQEIVKYLRREKEIVDVQLELSSQEAKRLKQQFNYTQSQLDDARLKLQQQSRVEADNASSAIAHRKLMETVQDLNTHRESNVTLRAEARQAQANLATRTKELEALRAEFEPLQDQVQEMKGDREAHEAEVKLLKENADRWQQRAQNVLQKYDRVDPAEIEALRDQIKNLEGERNELSSAKRTLQEALDATNAEKTQVQEQSNERVEIMRSRLTDQFKGRSKQLSDRIKEKDAQLQAAVNEKQGLEQRLARFSDTQAQLETARAEKDAAVQKLTNGNIVPDATGRNDSEEGEVSDGKTIQSVEEALQVARTKLEVAESRIEQEINNSASLRNELPTSKARVTELEERVALLQKSIEELNNEIRQLRTTPQQVSGISNTAELEAEINKLKEELSSAQQETQTLRTANPVNVTVAGGSTDDVSKSVADQVAEHVDAVRKELERRHDERVKQNEDNYNKRVDGMKAQLNKKLAEGKSQIRQSVIEEQEQALQAIKTQHEQETEQLRARHKDEMDELRRHEESRLTQMRIDWETERQNGGMTEDDTKAKTEVQDHDTTWNPTDQEARTLLQTNEVIRKAFKQNLISQTNKAKESQAAKLKEEHDKALAEAQAKANTAKEHAVMMEGKKTALQINMSNNKLRLAQFKVDAVQRAAQETPEKPVKVVWENVKDAKPPQPATHPNQPPSIKPPALASHITGQPTAIAPTSQVGPANGPKAQKISTQGAVAAPAILGQTTPSQPKPQPASPKPQRQEATTVNSTASPASASNPFQRPAATGEIQKQQQTTIPQSNANTALAAARPLQSGLPVPRGGANRGIQRGRGGGSGRGGPSIDTGKGRGQPQGRGSPTSGGMNPGAKQFVPGNKRPRDEGQDGSQAGDGPGKRIRGGGAGP